MASPDRATEPVGTNFGDRFGWFDTEEGESRISFSLLKGCDFFRWCFPRRFGRLPLENVLLECRDIVTLFREETSACWTSLIYVVRGRRALDEGSTAESGGALHGSGIG